MYLTPCDAADFAPERFPIWIWLDVPGIYGFPMFGEPAVKVAWNRCEILTDPETRSMEPDAASTATMRSFVADHLPGADAGVHLAKTCLYTLTPDRDFVLDRVPGSQRCYVAIGAGHAFKFASLLGKTLVELAVDGSTGVNLEPFFAERSILLEEEPRRTYMV